MHATSNPHKREKEVKGMRGSYSSYSPYKDYLLKCFLRLLCSRGLDMCKMKIRIQEDDQKIFSCKLLKKRSGGEGKKDSMHC